MDDYGNSDTTAELEWRDNMIRAMSESAALIDTLQRQGDITSEEINKIKADVAENSALTKEVLKNSGDLLMVFQAARGGFLVMEFIGKLAKIVVMIGAGYSAFQKLRHGIWPWGGNGS